MKLEKDLKIDMEAQRLYTNAPFQSSVPFKLNDLSSSLRRQINTLIHNSFLHSSQVDETCTFPPLQKAAANGSLGDIFSFMKLGADLNYSLPLQFFFHNRQVFGFEGCTLHLASWYGQFKSMEALLNLGANIKAKDRDGAEAIY